MGDCISKMVELSAVTDTGSIQSMVFCPNPSVKKPKVKARGYDTTMAPYSNKELTRGEMLDILFRVYILNLFKSGSLLEFNEYRCSCKNEFKPMCSNICNLCEYLSDKMLYDFEFYGYLKDKYYMRWLLLSDNDFVRNL